MEHKVKHKEHHVPHKHSSIPHKHGHVKLKGKNIWKSASVALAILLVISIYTGGFKFSKDSTTTGKVLTKGEASAKALDYVNKYLLTGATASLNGVEEDDGMYVLKLKIQDREFDSYVTKNGRLLFPQGIDMAIEPETPEAINPETPGQQEEVQAAEYPKAETPAVKMFVMTFCPFGQQAETGLKPAIELLNEGVDFEPHFVIYSNYASGYPDYCLDEENKYCSMHGITELNEGVRQLCIWKYDKEKWWNYVAKINEKCSNSNIETCWEEIAEETNVDADKIKTCQEEEAISLLAKEVELNQKYGVRGSPSVKINDKDYSGARTPEAYKSAICAAFTSAPDDCGSALSATGAAATGSC